jgi:hypothetical protein
MNELSSSCLSLTLLDNTNLVSTFQDKSVKIWNTNLFYNISIIRGYYNDINQNNVIKQKNNEKIVNTIEHEEKLSTSINLGEQSLNYLKTFFKYNELMDEKIIETINLLERKFDSSKKNNLK